MNNVVTFSNSEQELSGMEGMVLCLPDEQFEFVTADEIIPGSLVQICFGELGVGGIPKNRYSYQWVAVLEASSNQYLGITLERGWMAGPPAGTVFRFTNDEACKVGVPGSVGVELRKTFIWQENALSQTVGDLDNGCPF